VISQQLMRHDRLAHQEEGGGSSAGCSLEELLARRLHDARRRAPDSADRVWLLAGPSPEGWPDRELLLRAIISAACHASPRRMRTSWFAFHSCRSEGGGTVSNQVIR